jgi:phage terminase large subunit
MIQARAPLTPAEIELGRAISTSKGYARHVLKQDHYAKQDEMLDLLDRSRLVAVKGAHSVGKTRGIASFAIRQLNAWPDSIVLTTAPTWDQVKLLLWGNIKTVLRDCGMTFPEEFETLIRIAGDNYMMGRATNEGVRFQGFHSLHLTIICDEAPGIREEIFQAADGIAAGGNVTRVLLGNPIISSGRFYDSFGPDSGVDTLSISAFDTPNLLSPETGRPFTLDELIDLERHDRIHGTRWLEADPRPYLARRKWVLDMYRRHGPDSPEYQSRVLALFPDQARNALFPLPLLRRAQIMGEQADYTLSDDPRWTAGIDVAGEGSDETAVAIFQRGILRGLSSWAHPDARPDVLRFLEPYRDRLAWGGQRNSIRVDAIGQGYHFAGWLEDQGYRGQVLRVNVQQAADTLIPPHRLKDRADAKGRFHDLKAWLSWSLREQLMQETLVGTALSQQAITQLAGIRYAVNAKGRIQVESKDDMAKRGMASPDLADAIVLGAVPLDGYLIPSAVSYTRTHRRRSR